MNTLNDSEIISILERKKTINQILFVQYDGFVINSNKTVHYGRAYKLIIDYLNNTIYNLPI